MPKEDQPYTIFDFRNDYGIVGASVIVDAATVRATPAVVDAVHKMTDRLESALRNLTTTRG